MAWVFLSATALCAKILITFLYAFQIHTNFMYSNCTCCKHCILLHVSDWFLPIVPSHDSAVAAAAVAVSGRAVKVLVLKLDKGAQSRT